MKRNKPLASGALHWRHPLEAARKLCADQTHFALLYSGERRAHTGRYSYLALHPQEDIRGEDYGALARKLSTDRGAMENAWFGYLGYEMLHESETLAKESRHAISLPALRFTRYGTVLRFDHQERAVLWAGIKPPVWPSDNEAAKPVTAKVEALSSFMTRESYLALVAQTRQAILRGDFYQANITRKFTGRFDSQPDAFALFERLCAVSPAAYSAFLQWGDSAILSSSPERFMTIDATGHMQTRPIKGTARRGGDSAADETAREGLRASIKDRAENLMIVDLMRNDLARSAIPGSVKAEALFDIETYATLHHMESTVTAQKKGDVTALDAVRLAFPPGSMTGAPKISAMQWCLAHEAIQRGVYSGALGWFGGDGSCDLSVVIRTLVLHGREFEFQVGGAIVADSEPQAEWQETLTKARGIMAALGADMALLEAL